MAGANGTGNGEGGPPKGSELDSAHTQIVQRNPRDAIEAGIGGQTPPVTDDPAFQPPRDPLAQGNPKARSKLILRELPVITIQNNWTAAQTAAALYGHTIGQFQASGDLIDSITGDDRVQATLGSRIGGLFGSDVLFTPAGDSDAARECYLAWRAAWPRIGTEAALSELQLWSLMAGQAFGTLAWDTTKPVWVPELTQWHLRYFYWHWTLRHFIAITQDGQRVVFPGDAQWVCHAPHGQYRGWMRGAVRPTAEPWLFRHWARRDWARFSEVHGLPTRVGGVPAAADPIERAAFEQSIANLGSDTSMILPKGVEPQEDYSYDLVEATDTAGKDAFEGLIAHCDRSIVLTLQYQNLTTEVDEGSLAAARVHAAVKQAALNADNRALALTIYQQIARPFALLNFGDADLAPWTQWDTTPPEDYAANADRFAKLGTALETMARGGIKFKDPAQLNAFIRRVFGLPQLPDFDITDPAPQGGEGGFGK